MQEVEQRVHKDVLRRKQLCEKIQIGGGADFCVYCSFLQESAHYLLLNDLCFKAYVTKLHCFLCTICSSSKWGKYSCCPQFKAAKKDSHVHI